MLYWNWMISSFRKYEFSLNVNMLNLFGAYTLINVRCLSCLSFLFYGFSSFFLFHIIFICFNIQVLSSLKHLHQSYILNMLNPICLVSLDFLLYGICYLHVHQILFSVEPSQQNYLSNWVQYVAKFGSLLHMLQLSLCFKTTCREMSYIAGGLTS